ncbi:hypothetical protein RS85_00149 [Microbacterium sp. SA39]|nr:hypothetical protein RS85_00149 [Microbacterium sp. SA39]
MRAAFAAAAVAAVLTMAGCVGPKTELDAQTSEQWQAQVLAIAESAEAGDPATALTDLAALETETTQARSDGEISAERAAIIQQSIAAVRADLEAASVPPPTVPDDTVVTDPVVPAEDDDSNDEGDENGNKDDKKEKDDKGKGDKGKGNDD